MSRKLLSLVTDEDGTYIAVHLDLAGTDFLIKELQAIRDQLEKNECPHTHLFSDVMGSNELTTTKLSGQEEEVNQVHHVKIYGWNQEWKQKHNLG
jgi:hypothetical protein